MKNINIRRIWYKTRYEILTTNNLVVGVALLIAVGFAYGSVQVLQRNYALQQEIAEKNKLRTLRSLEVQTLELQQSYYRTDEYKELMAREKLGKVFPGEKVLILPGNSKEAQEYDEKVLSPARVSSTPTNTEKWFNFLFGGSAQ